MPPEISLNCYHCLNWRPPNDEEASRRKSFIKHKDFFTHPGPSHECKAALDDNSKIIGRSKKPVPYLTKPGHACNVLIDGKPGFDLHPAIDVDAYNQHLQKHAAKLDDGAGQ